MPVISSGHVSHSAQQVASMLLDGKVVAIPSHMIYLTSSGLVDQEKSSIHIALFTYGEHSYAIVQWGDEKIVNWDRQAFTIAVMSLPELARYLPTSPDLPDTSSIPTREELISAAQFVQRKLTHARS